MNSGLSKYKLESNPLGRGAFGIVYKAKHRKSGNICAIKEHNKTDSRSLEKCKKEAYILRRLKHPHVVLLLDYFIDHGKFYHVMEFCAQGDLRHIIRSRRKKHFSEKQIVVGMLQMSQAVHYIHKQKILHRDIKPENFFMAENRRIKLGDFGLATELESFSGLAHSYAGTRIYMAPEILSHHPYNNKSDVWSLGCVLYELACLRPAFYPRRNTDAHHIEKTIKRGRYTPPPAHYSENLHDLVQKMIRVEAKHRMSIAQVLKHPLLKEFVKSISNKNKQNVQSPVLNPDKPATEPEVPNCAPKSGTSPEQIIQDPKDETAATNHGAVDVGPPCEKNEDPSPNENDDLLQRRKHAIKELAAKKGKVPRENKRSKLSTFLMGQIRYTRDKLKAAKDFVLGTQSGEEEPDSGQGATLSGASYEDSDDGGHVGEEEPCPEPRILNCARPYEDFDDGGHAGEEADSGQGGILSATSLEDFDDGGNMAIYPLSGDEEAVDLFNPYDGDSWEEDMEDSTIGNLLAEVLRIQNDHGISEEEDDFDEILMDEAFEALNIRSEEINRTVDY